MNSKRYLLVLATLILSLLYAENTAGELRTEYENQFFFSIRYLGVKVANVEMTDWRLNGEGRIEVKAKSVSFGNLLFKIDNTYIVDYQDEFRPYKYSRSIKQKNFSQDQITIWIYSEKKMETWLDGELTNSSIFQSIDSRDFFSALLFIRNLDIADRNFHQIMLYANNNNWSANISFSNKERVGKYDALKYKIEFQQETDHTTQRSDVLTNNIVKENNALYLWFSDDEKRLPLQAEYESSPFPVFWTLEDYKISPVAVKSSDNGYRERR